MHMLWVPLADILTMNWMHTNKIMTVKKHFKQIPPYIKLQAKITARITFLK